MISRGLLAGLALAFVTGPAALGVTFTGNYTSSDPEIGALSAEADFTAGGGSLFVTLTNIGTEDIEVPSQVLTAVFFDIAGDPGLTPTSAVLGPDSKVFYNGYDVTTWMTDPGGGVGGEWAYQTDLDVDTPSGMDGDVGGQGISSAGLDLFGPNDRFPGSNLAGPASPDGLQYGLLSEGDDPSSGNRKVRKEYLVQDAVTFELTGLPQDFDATEGITNVWFQYGTSLKQPRFRGTPPPPPSGAEPIPEPITMFGLGLGCAGVGAYIRRR